MRISDWSSDVCSSDLAAGDVQEAVIVDATAIAGAQPAVIGERFARFLRLAEIAAHDRRMLELDFAVGIEAKPRTGQRSADCTGARRFRPFDRGVRAVLGHAVKLGRAPCMESLFQYVSISVDGA